MVLRNPTGTPQQLAAYERVKREQERRKVWEVLLHLHSRLQVHKELQKAGYRRKKHIQNYLLTNDAENVMNKYPFLDLLL